MSTLGLDFEVQGRQDKFVVRLMESCSVHKCLGHCCKTLVDENIRT